MIDAFAAMKRAGYTCSFHNLSFSADDGRECMSVSLYPEY